MRLTKTSQYGLMMVFYLKRAGMASTRDVAHSLDLPLAMLEQIGRKLKLAGILTVKRGPGGGYSVNGDPTIRVVLEALGERPFLPTSESLRLSIGPTEMRALAHLVGATSVAVGTVLNASISQALNNSVQLELSQLDSISETARAN